MIFFWPFWTFLSGTFRNDLTGSSATRLNILAHVKCDVIESLWVETDADEDDVLLQMTIKNHSPEIHEHDNQANIFLLT